MDPAKGSLQRALFASYDSDGLGPFFAKSPGMNTFYSLCRFVLVLLLWGSSRIWCWAQPGGAWHPDANGDGEVGTQDLLELLAVFGGQWKVMSNDSLALSTHSLTPCAGEDAVRFQGETYEVVAIGSQCWFAENLRSLAYADGTPLLSGLSSSDWLSADVGAMAVYGEGASRVYAGDEDEWSNLALFGRLYNGWAVVDPRGLCPAGWRVPSAADWEVLLEALGGPCLAGERMRPVAQDRPDFDGSRGFNALMGGGRNYGGFYGSGGESAFFWSTKWEERMGWYIRVEASGQASGGGWTNRGMGASVRCLRN